MFAHKGPFQLITSTMFQILEMPSVLDFFSLPCYLVIMIDPIQVLSSWYCFMFSWNYKLWTLERYINSLRFQATKTQIHIFPFFEFIVIPLDEISIKRHSCFSFACRLLPSFNAGVNAHSIKSCYTTSAWIVVVGFNYCWSKCPIYNKLSSFSFDCSSLPSVNVGANAHSIRWYHN